MGLGSDVFDSMSGMTGRKPSRAATRRAPSKARLALAFLMLFAFTLQAFVTQTHIHIGSNAVTAGVVVEKTTPGKTSPLDNESTNCLFCQEMLHSGQFVTPAAAAILLSVNYVSIVPIHVVLPLFVGAIPHGWQGRAPPQH